MYHNKRTTSNVCINVLFPPLFIDERAHVSKRRMTPKTIVKDFQKGIFHLYQSGGRSYASQFCLKLLEAVTQQAQIACLQQVAGMVQHLLGGCILFSEQVQFGQPEVNLDMQVRCCYERSLCTCLFKQEDSSLQIALSLS